MQELLSQRFEAQRQKLVSMDIVAVAESLGMILKSGSSGAYYWEEHDSFHIYPNTNTFRWWSRGVGTNTIDLVQVVQEELTGHKPSFREATSFLETGQFNNVTVQPPVKEPFEYYLERYEHPDFNIGRQYLKEERGLSDVTIDTFLASGNLATATRKKGDYFEPVIVFKSRDNDGKMIGASLQGIVENRVQHPERGRLKQIMKNSEGTAGFSLDIGTPKRLVFAEAPIDLMSYYEVNKDDLQDVKLVAMDGLKKGVVSRYVADLLTDGKYSQTMSAEQIRGALDALNQTTNLLQEHSDMITLAVDNDEAGQNFVKGLQEDGIPVIPDLPPRQTAQKKMDWNDYLKQMKKESAQMAENQEKSGGILPEKNIDGGEQKSLESFSDTQKEAVGELKSYGTFIIDDDFLERHYGSVDKEKSLETPQETVDSHSGQEKMDRSKTSLGSLEGNPPGSAEPVSETDTFEQAVTSHPTFSYPLLQFSTEEAFVSNVRESYHIATQADIRSLNYYAPSLQQTANWYRDNLADSQITYMLKGDEGVKALQVNFAKDKFAHLTGIRPIGKGLSAEKLLDDFAEGRGHYPNLTLSNGFNDKIQVLPMLQELSQSKAFVFSDLSEVEKMKNLNASHAIQSNNRSLVVALKTIDNVTFPSSLLKGKKKLTNELIEKANENDILGVVREKEGVVSVLSVNDNFIKDGGEELRLMVERKQLEEVKAIKARTKDSDGDGLSDDEEIALGTNPYSPDTDGDGVIDSIERGSGTDATNSSDTPDNRQNEQTKHNLALSEMIKAKDTAALNQHLQEGIKDYFDSDTYKNYLEGMAHFNHYSARNIQLIKAQLPEATMVASFEEWKKRNGHVNKGEKALYVQAPVTVIKKDADGNPVVNSETGEKEIFTYFKPVPVFDISQISPQQGKQLNLPKSSEAIPAQLNKDYYQNIYRALRDISQKENGIPIRFRELEQSDGFYNPKTNDITIKKGMTYEQTLSTLIHEMAHSELHNKKSLTERFEGKLTRSSKELQAESVAYVVSNHLGFDTSNDSFAYLASWSQEPDGLENLKAQLEIVQEEASSLMNRIDKQLTKYQTLTVSKDEPLTETQKRNLEKSANPFYQSLQKAKAEINNMKKGDEPSNEKTAKKDNRPTKC